MSKKPKYTYQSTSDLSQPQKGNNKNKFKEKAILVLKSKTEYISMIPLDVLYRQNLSHLSNREYQFVLEKLLMDLNALLYFSEDDFFEQLETSQSLRSCLQSCLTCLAKNSYYNLSSKRVLAINRQELRIPNDFFLYYQKIHQVLVKIYYRISHAEKQQHKQIVYDFWLMDMPKMIDLAMIYCVRLNENIGEYDNFTNLEIVKQIISKAISTNPKDYARDFDDFINILYQDKLPLIHKDIQLVMNLQENAMEYAKINFAEPQRSFLISANKILFEIKDLFTIVTYIYACFPQAYRNKLATDHQVLQDMIKIFVQFVESSRLWKTGKNKEKFQTSFQAIQQTCCQNFYFNFKIIKRIIQKGDSLANDFYSRALNSYCVHSMYFTSPKINEQNQKIYQQMVKTIVYRMEHDQQMFFLAQAPSNLKFIKISQAEKVAIRKSHGKINSIYKEINLIIENQQVQRRIRGKIQKFFNEAQKIQKNKKFSNENKMIFGGKIREIKPVSEKQRMNQEQKNQKDELENHSQQQQSIDESLDFQVLNKSSFEQQDQDLDLSFDALKSSNSNNSDYQQLSFDQLDQPSQIKSSKNSKLKQQNKVQNLEPAKPQMYAELYEKQNNLHEITYRKTRNLLYKDQHPQLSLQKQDYYKYHKPQYGHYMGRLIERS